MKKQLFYLLLAPLCLFGTENLLMNASFRTTDLQTGLPGKWRNIPELSGKRSVHPEQKNTYMLELAAPVSGKRVLWIGTLEPIRINTRYRVQAQVRMEKGAWGQLYVERSKPTFKSFNGNTPIHGTGTWRKISFEFCFDTPGAQPYIVFATASTQPAAIADMSVQLLK